MRDEDLTKYDTLLVGFDRKMVMPVGQIRLPIVTKVKEVMVNFIVVYVFSSYTAILMQLWIHAMGAILSMLHININFPIEKGIVVVRGDQSVAWQCLVVTINHEIKQKEQVKLEPL